MNAGPDDAEGAVGAHERTTDGPDPAGRAAPLTAEVVAEMGRTVTAFARAPEPFRDIVELVVRRIVDQVLAVFAELRPATRAEVRDLVEVCIPPTDQGITLEDMLSVFGIAQDVLWREVDRLRADDAVSPERALELGRLGVDLLSSLSRGVTAEYLRGDRVWLQRRDAEHALVRGVLDAQPRMEEATRAAHALDLRLFGAWRCAAYEAVDAAGPAPDELRTLLDDGRQTWGIRGAVATDGDVVLLLTQGDEPVPPPADTRCGVGDVHEGTQGMRVSHDEALDALAVARAGGHTRLTVAEARLGRVLLGSLSPAALADAVLAPLGDEPEGRRAMLAETLEAWLDAQGSPSGTADRLQLHVQSARYRIEQLRTVFGDVLDDPDQRLLLHLAVRSTHLA